MPATELLAPGSAPTPPKQKRARRTKQPRGLKIDIGVALAICEGLTAADATSLVSIATVLQETANKRSRAKIVTALGKLFG